MEITRCLPRIAPSFLTEGLRDTCPVLTFPVVVSAECWACYRYVRCTPQEKTPPCVCFDWSVFVFRFLYPGRVWVIYCAFSSSIRR